MINTKLWLVALSLFALAIGGKFLVGPEKLQARQKGVAQIASTQLLGGLRAVPLMALWGRVESAQKRGQWFEQLALFDLIAELAPENASIIYYQSRVEVLSVAPKQSTRQASFLWVDRALDRLMKSRTRLNNAALIEEGVWDIGFYAGERFPLQYALAIAADQGDGELSFKLLSIQGAVQGNETLIEFLDEYGLSLDYINEDHFLALSEDSQQALMLLDKLRWQAMVMAAQRGLSRRRGQSSDLAFKFLISLRRVGAYKVSENKLAALRALAAQALKDEIERLEKLGEDGRARDFYDQMNFLIGDWMAGKDEPE